MIYKLCRIAFFGISKLQLVGFLHSTLFHASAAIIIGGHLESCKSLYNINIEWSWGNSPIPSHMLPVDVAKGNWFIRAVCRQWVCTVRVHWDVYTSPARCRQLQVQQPIHILVLRTVYRQFNWWRNIAGYTAPICYWFYWVIDWCFN